MFAEDLAGGRFDLSRTKAWLNTTISERLAELASRDAEGVNHLRQQPSVFTLVNQGYISLLIHLNPLSSVILPETFHMDGERVVNLYKEVNTVVVSSAMLLTIKSLLRKDARTAWKGAREKTAELMEDPRLTSEAKADALVTFLKDDLGTGISEAQVGHIRPAVKRLFGNVENAKRGDTSGLLADPVVKVILARLKGFILARLNAQTPKDKVRLASGAVETLTSFGMAEQVVEVAGIVDGVLRLAAANRECYWKWYEEIVSDAMAQED